MRIDFANTALPDRGVLAVSGVEARALLNRLVTADIEHMRVHEAAYCGLLTPQGKIQFDFFVYLWSPEGPDYFLLDCAKTQLAGLQKRLELYRLRADVRISPVTNLVGYASSEEPQIKCHKYRDPRSSEIGWRGLVQTELQLQTIAGYHHARIAAGLADTDADLGSGEFFPHEANFDQIGAVSFSKGCYIGQEVVSRMEHRGTARARILPVQCDGLAPAKGSDIRSGDKSIGTMLGADGDIGLALIRLDRLTEATAPLLSQGVSITVQKPAFARYDVPGAK